MIWLMMKQDKFHRIFTWMIGVKDIADIWYSRSWFILLFKEGKNNILKATSFSCIVHLYPALPHTSWTFEITFTFTQQGKFNRNVWSDNCNWAICLPYQNLLRVCVAVGGPVWLIQLDYDQTDDATRQIMPQIFDTELILLSKPMHMCCTVLMYPGKHVASSLKVQKMWNDSTPSFGHWRGNALFQSIRLAITANVSRLELLSNTVRIRCNILIR